MAKLPLRLALLAALAFAGAPARSQDPATHVELGGAHPGMSGAATASAIARAWPGAVLWDPVEMAPASGTLTDAIASDCTSGGPRLRFCVALLAVGQGSSSGLIDVEAAYSWPAGGSEQQKILERLRATLSWSQPAEGGWERFLSTRPAPRLSGSMPKAKAIKAFSGSAQAARSAARATKFSAALWRMRSPSGVPFEIAAVGALDARGRLLALATESGSLPRAVPQPAPAMP